MTLNVKVIYGSRSHLVHLKVYPKRLLCPSMKTIHSLITKIFENVIFVDGRTDRRTEGKPIVPSGQTGRGLITVIYWS